MQWRGVEKVGFLRGEKRQWRGVEILGYYKVKGGNGIGVKF